jgi:hypothetical protein
MTTDTQDAAASSGLIPRPRHYRTETTPAALPFIAPLASGGLHSWVVPPIDDYALACEIGEQYALHFAQYLNDNPDVAGTNLLGEIAGDIDFHDESCAKGYWVGFFGALEPMILAYARHAAVFSAPAELAR